MKTRCVILAPVCVRLHGLGWIDAPRDETPVSAGVAKDLKSDKEADKLQGLNELEARGEKAAEGRRTGRSLAEGQIGQGSCPCGDSP